jgi:hypothetical protein
MVVEKRWKNSSRREEDQEKTKKSWRGKEKEEKEGKTESARAGL